MKSCSRSNGYFQRRGFVRNSNELSNELSQPFAQKNSHFTPYSGRHSLPSTSSSSAYSSDDSHEEQEIKKINVNPSGQSKTTSDGKVTKCVAANGNKLYITDETGKTKRQDIAQASSLSLQIAERIDLDHAKFGKANDRLMPWSDESSDEESKTEEDSQENGKGIRQDYARLYAKVGLPVQLDSRGQGAVIEDKAQIYSETRCAMFGCKALPTSLLTKTFKGWMETPTSMCRLIISTQDENNRRKMEEMSSVLPLFKVWSLSEHETSIYRMQDVSAYKEKCKEKDLADIYVLICEDGRMAAMGVSNFVLSVFFGGPVDDFPNNFVFPVMKSAFSEITGCNNFYEIREPQLKEAWAKRCEIIFGPKVTKYKESFSFRYLETELSVF